MARTTAPLTLAAPHPCHASTLHATPGGSHHNSTGAHISHTLCTAQRSDLLSLTLYGSVFSTAHSLLPAHHGASPATSLGRRSSAARAHQWCHLPPPSVLVLLFLRPELLSGGHELVARHMPQSPSGLPLPALSALWPRPSPTALGCCSLEIWLAAPFPPLLPVLSQSSVPSPLLVASARGLVSHLALGWGEG